MFDSANIKQFTFTNFFAQKFNSRTSRTQLDDLKKLVNINEAAKVTSLDAHNRLSSCASTDSAFYDQYDTTVISNNLKAFKTKFDNLKEIESDDLKSIRSIATNNTNRSRNDLKKELM